MANMNTSVTGAPKTGTTPEPQQTSSFRSAKPVLIMLLLFALPYVISWYYLFSDEPVIEISPSNKGVLISPMRALDNLGFDYLVSQYQQGGESADEETAAIIESGSTTVSQWQGSWTMVTVIDSACEDACQKTLFNMGQVRRAMGVGRDQVKRVALVTDTAQVDTIRQRVTEYPGTLFMMSPRTSVDRLLSQLGGAMPSMTHGVFLVDPFGNFMMAYTPEMPAKYLLDDLERLFKVNKK